MELVIDGEKRNYEALELWAKKRKINWLYRAMFWVCNRTIYKGIVIEISSKEIKDKKDDKEINQLLREKLAAAVHRKLNKWLGE